MELKEFVKFTVNDLLDAVSEVTEERGKKRGGEKVSLVSLDKNKETRTIEFDVAVVAETESGKEKGGSVRGGVRVLGFDVGGKSAVMDKTSVASRIQFGISVYTSEDAEEKRRMQESLRSMGSGSGGVGT
jgi:hypothetical protein